VKLSIREYYKEANTKRRAKYKRWKVQNLKIIPGHVVERRISMEGVGHER
jgi:hypothetical protein